MARTHSQRSYRKRVLRVASTPANTEVYAQNILPTARNLIEVTYKVVPNHKLAVYEFYEGQKVKDTNVRITAFEAEVRQCGFMSFDTEGGGNLPRKSGETKDDKRIFVSMSCPKTGSVLLFHCMNDVPNILLKLLSDYAVAKIQSNIAADVKILDDAGYDV